MNIVAAPDSFKGSLSSVQASAIIKNSILEVHPKSDVVLKPMADGGEGTMEAMLSAADGVRIPLVCTGPLGEEINTEYAIIGRSTAIIECAAIAGLVLVPEDKRNPDLTTSFGIGEAITDALNRGCNEILVGLGGSATNDGGIGMLQALGMKATDRSGERAGIFGGDLIHVHKIDFSNIDARLAEAEIKVACDVDNPLTGERGATAVYGPQKGAAGHQIVKYDNSLNHYGNLIETVVEQPLMDKPGAGAAGGLGFAMLAIGAALVSGAELVAKTIKVEEAIEQADLVITGEGQSDEQTLYGKAPGYIAALARKHDVPVVLLSGSLFGDLDVLREHFSGCFSITNKPMSLEECMKNAPELMAEQTKQIIHLIHML